MPVCRLTRGTVRDVDTPERKRLVVLDDGIVCSLDGGDMRTRLEEWKDLLTTALIERRVIEGGVALRLKAAPVAVSELRRLVELEQRCCSWIQWRISEGDVLSVEATSSDEDGARLLAEWFGASST